MADFTSEQIQDYMGRIKQWLKDRGEVGWFLVEFADEVSKGVGEIKDPAGPRWVHLWVQDPTVHEIFNYQCLEVDEDDFDMILPEEEDDEEGKGVLVSMTDMIAELTGDEDSPISEEKEKEEFLNDLKYGWCEPCQAYHVEKQHAKD